MSVVHIDFAPTAIKEGRVAVQPEDEIWATSKDNVHRLADDIMLRFEGSIDLKVCCIGAGAVNQAVKAIAVVREIASRDGYDIVCQPYFSTIEDERGEQRSRMVFYLLITPE